MRTNFHAKLERNELVDRITRSYKILLQKCQNVISYIALFGILQTTNGAQYDAVAIIFHQRMFQYDSSSTGT